MRVLFQSGFDVYSGYGNDAVDIALSLEARGVDVLPLPTGLLPGLPRKFTDLLTKEPRGTKPDLVLRFGPPQQMEPSKLGREAGCEIGYSMWEKSALIRDDMPDRWGEDFDTADGRWWSAAPGRKEFLDLMLVTCPMNVDAFHALDPHVPVKVLPCGIDSAKWEVTKRDPQRRMTFGMIGMLAGRKDPFVMLEAWKELKAEDPEFDALLEMKTMTPGLHPKIEGWVPDVKIHQSPWTPKQVADWYQTIDVLVSTSRGEGNNKPAMEMMASGGTVIASDWSGHRNWLMPGTSFPVGGKLEPVGSGSPALEFRIDKEELKATIRKAWLDRAETSQMGMRAARWIRESLDWSVVAGKMERLMQQTLMELG